MHINNLPLEILKLVFEKLAEPRRPSHDDIVHYNYNLRKARRVCRLWNLIITPQFYSTIRLKHKQGEWSNQEFISWNRIIDLPVAKKAARCVIINTASSDRYRDIDDKQWSGGTFPAFTSAMDRLIELPNVTSVCIQFHDSCIGKRRNDNGEIEDNDEYYIDQDDAGDFKELPGTRRRFLEAVFAAIDKRATNPQNSTISSLTIFNLHPGTWDQVFQDIKQSLSRLIDMQVQLSWYGPCFKGNKPLLPYDGYVSFHEGHRQPWDSTHGGFDWRGKYCLDLARGSWRARKLRNDPIRREETERFAREAYKRDLDSLSSLLEDVYERGRYH